MRSRFPWWWGIGVVLAGCATANPPNPCANPSAVAGMGTEAPPADLHAMAAVDPACPPVTVVSEPECPGGLCPVPSTPAQPPAFQAPPPDSPLAVGPTSPQERSGPKDDRGPVYARPACAVPAAAPSAPALAATAGTEWTLGLWILAGCVLIGAFLALVIPATRSRQAR